MRSSRRPELISLAEEKDLNLGGRNSKVAYKLLMRQLVFVGLQLHETAKWARINM